MTPYEDHRRHDRYAGTLTVKVSGDGTQRFATIYEVSLGGAFLEVSPLPGVGAIIDLTIVEGGQRQVLHAEVRYRAASEVGARGVEGVGISWRELDPEAQALIERLVGRAQAGKPLRGP